MNYAYFRVSTKLDATHNQTFDRQALILKQNGYEVEESNIFAERISGGVATSERPEWEKLMEIVKEGDTIIVSEMSRLARSLQDLIETVNYLIDRKIGIVFIKEHISVSSTGIDAMNQLIFHIFGAIAEFEKALIGDRTKMALQAKKEAGVVLGRKKKLDDFNTRVFIDMYNNDIPYSIMQQELNLTRPSIIAYAKELNLKPRNTKRKQVQEFNE